MKLQAVDYFFGAQGVFLLANGFFVILAPQQADAMPMLKGTPRDVLLSSGLMSIGLGGCYLQAAYLQNRPLMKLAVAGRLLAIAVFGLLSDDMKRVAGFEAIMAATGAFLLKSAAPAQ